jgi:hypothetical protein
MRDFPAVNAVYARWFQAALPGAYDGRGGGATARAKVELDLWRR